MARASRGVHPFLPSDPGLEGRCRNTHTFSNISAPDSLYFEFNFCDTRPKQLEVLQKFPQINVCIFLKQYVSIETRILDWYSSWYSQ